MLNLTTKRQNKTCKHSLACMSWPWRPNTWEKGLRLQVSISSMAERSSVCWGSALRVSLRVWGGSAVALKQSSPLTLWQLTANSRMKPPHDLLCAFPRAVICLFFLTAASPLTADLSWVSPPQMPSELPLLLSWWEICVGLLSACSLALLRGAASDREHRQTQHEQSKRERESKRWEGEACCRERTDSLLPTRARIEMTACACVKKSVSQAACASSILWLVSCSPLISPFNGTWVETDKQVCWELGKYSR